MAASELQAIKKAIAELAHHDPAARFGARGFLVQHATAALPLIQETLKNGEKLSVDYSREIARVRDWIVYGEDPERLHHLIQALDLRHLSHGNMFGGMLGAIESAPQFKEFIELGSRVLPFLQAVLEDKENAYSLRGAAAAILEKTGSARNVPTLIAVLDDEHRMLEATGHEVIKLEEQYRGFFIATVHYTLTLLTGEFFLRPIFQPIVSGMPEFIYNVPLSASIIQRWRDWWEKLGPQIESGEAPANKVEELLNELSTSTDNSYARYALNRIGAAADPLVVNFILARSSSDSAAVLLVEMLIQNGRAVSLPEGQHAGELIAVWLGSLHDSTLLRDAVLRGYAQLPASTLRAISNVFPTHPLATKYPHLFNPYTLTSMETPRGDLYSDAATEDLIHGLLSTDLGTRSLFFEIAQGAAIKVSARRNQQTPSLFTERLSQIQNNFTAFSDRVALMRVLKNTGVEIDLGETLKLLRDAKDESNTESVADLIDLIPGKEVPESQRPLLTQQLVELIKARPPLSRACLSLLEGLTPEYFQYSPAIGSRGVSALVQVYEQAQQPAESVDNEKLTNALREFRQDIHEYVIRSEFLQRYLAASALDLCIKFARRFELHSELYDSLTHKAQILGQIELISTPSFEDFKQEIEAALGYECDYFKCLEEESEPNTYDQAGCLFEGAARVAAEHGLGKDKVIIAQLSIADMAGKAKRHDYAEEVYLGLDVAGDFVAFQKHYYSELLVRQGRWADAREVAFELRAWYQQREKEFTPNDSHLFNDTFLHEFFCYCRFNNYRQALKFVDRLMENYQQLGILQHYAEVFTEAVWINVRAGAEGIEDQFKSLQETLPDDPRAGFIRLGALEREGAYLLSVGKTERAVEVLDQARLLWETLPRLENHPQEKIAEVYWLLGQAHLMKGDAQRANEVLVHLQSWSASPLVQIYRMRLQAKIEASFGSIAAALTTLQEGVDLPRTKAFADLRVELFLDLGELLIREGFYERCMQVLNQAFEIAAEARNPHLMASIVIMQAQVFESAGQPDQAGDSYRDVINNDLATEIPDLVAVASLNILSLLAAKEGNINLANDVDGIKKSLSAIQDVRWRTGALQRFARLYLSNNRAEQADVMLALLDEEIRSGTPLNLVLEYKMLRGDSARLHKRAAEAVDYYREAVNILEVVHSSVLERGLGAGFFVSKDSPYRMLVQALVDAGRYSEALHYVERAKTRLFLDQIHWRVINNYDEANPLVRYLQILKRLAFLELDTEKAEGKDHRDERAALEKELETLRASIPEKELVAAVYPVLGGPTDTLRDLKSVLGTGSTPIVLAEYFMTDEALLLFVMRNDSNEPEVITIERTPAEIREFVLRNFQADTDAEGRVLKSTGEKVRRLDEAAFQEFFAPLVAPLVSKSSEGDLIWFVPYDVLHYLPLHALRVDGRFLIERNAVVYSPSASIMKYCQAEHRSGHDSVLVVGDSLNDLPHAREEALTVSKLFGADPLLGSDATKSAVTDLIKQAGQSLDILHFSCHGYFDSLEALKSGIMLAPGDNQSADGRQWSLTAEEIFNIELNAGLVTLSACETGVSEQRHGDELVGLTRALIYAGIPAVIVSLWTVNDTSTALLMNQFYSKLREPNTSKIAALQSAQKYLLKLTAKDCIEYCDKRVAELTADVPRSIRHRFDRATFHVLAGDLQTAIVEYKQIRQDLAQTPDAWASLVCQQIDRRLPQIEIKAEEDPPKIDFSIRVYQKIYHWAPFVLVGDWR